MVENSCALAKRKCVPCSGDVPPLSLDQCRKLHGELKNWELVEAKRLVKSYKFKDFQSAMDLANKIAVIAEEEGHHPDLLVRWGELRIDLWTHAVNGLTESDFILAAKIDCLP